MRLTLLAAALLSATTAMAQEQLTAELRKAAVPIELRDGEVSGAGADLLDRELASTQFFLVGEDHGSAESATIAAALLRRGWKHGYRHLAIEVGPITVDRFLAESKKRDPVEVATSYATRYPWEFAFMQWKEEVNLFATAVRLSNAAPDSVWGLDQEFVTSPAFHLDWLLTQAKTDATRLAVTALLDRVHAGEREMLTKHSPQSIFFITAKQDDFAALRSAFGPAPSPEVKRVLDELEESWKIYQLNFTGKIWQNNYDRSLMLRRHFLARYRAARAAGESAPKVFFKFGGSHMMRGRSVAGVFDLGTMMPELAAENGNRSFQLYIAFGGGFVNAHRPFSADDTDKRSPYEPKYENVEFGPVTSAATGDGWVLIDLRPFHPILDGDKLGKIAAPLRELLRGYDAILIVPKASPATLIE